MAKTAQGTGSRTGLRLMTLFGIEIRLDFSIVFIFALIVYSLGAGLFPQWHPQWTPLTGWSTAFGAGVMFFASLLAHELAHALTARRYGIRVPRITLFLFGGMAEIESEAETPQSEFTIAIAGPLMSAALGVLFSIIVSLAADAATLAQLRENPEAALQALSPFLTACLWLSSVNIILAVFNLIPGFPLDGGRVFRALVWRITGDYLKATRAAATAGRWFGWLLMGLGLWNLLVFKSLGGLWLVLIGWFLSHLAVTSFNQLLAQRSLRSITVADVMRTHFETVPTGTDLHTFVEDYLLRSSQQLWPVLSPSGLEGFLTITEVSAVPLEERRSRTVADVMRPPSATQVLDAGSQATSALTTLMQSGDQPAAVMSGDRLLGLLRASDILRWITLHPAPDRQQ